MTTDSGCLGDSPVRRLKTNWNIAGGDLESAVTFDCSSNSEEIADSVPKSGPLILKPPSPESGPCEIQLSFSQKYEIWQIYVRSTARVYEVYYSQSQQSSNEYLCTVRCNVAERDGKVLQAVDIRALADRCTTKSSEELNQEKLPSEGNSVTSEDDWVEVRAVDPPHLENKISSLSMNGCTYGATDIQDFYEATAEISDSDFCTCLTIRLLSLQNRGCVCIDEVYIFADPVVSIEPENHAHLGNCSAGSSLMAMLVPTFLQLSRCGSNQLQSKQASHDLLKSNQLEAQSKAADVTDNAKGKVELVENSLVSTDLTNDTSELLNKVQMETQSVAADSTNGAVAKDNPDKIWPKSIDLHKDAIRQQDKSVVAEQASVNLDDANVCTDEPAECQLPHQILDGDTSSVYPLVSNNSADNRVEKILEQLLFRVTKIEEVCLRFEESMLNPMSNMEMRIQRVEQQLDLLAKNSQYSGLPQYAGFSAPPSSCDSNSTLLHDDGRNYQPCSLNEFEKKEFTFSHMVKPCENGMSDSRNSGLSQGVQFSAPLFSFDSSSSLFHDNGFSHQPRDSHEFENKDFAASHLLKPCDNGMSNSVNTLHLLPSLVVTAPEFPGEDDQDVDELITVQDSPAQMTKQDQDVDELKLTQDYPVQNPKRILIDDVLAASLSGFLSESGGHPSKDKQPNAIVSDGSKVYSKNVHAEDVHELPTRTVEVTADSCFIEERDSYPQFLIDSAPDFALGGNVGEEYSDFQSASLLNFASKLEEDDGSASVEERVGVTSVIVSEPSSSLADFLTLSLVSEFAPINYSAAQPPLEGFVGDKEEIKSVSNPLRETFRAAASPETGYLFDFFNDIEPLTCKHLFPGSGSGSFEVTGRSNQGSSGGDPCSSFNQDTVLSLI